MAATSLRWRQPGASRRCDVYLYVCVYVYYVYRRYVGIRNIMYMCIQCFVLHMNTMQVIHTI